jgi:hypothetical protein
MLAEMKLVSVTAGIGLFLLNVTAVSALPA